tara:strand:- start:2287 stop:2898 length:612 start_codon:yes stop_codon:yes gene_type:complete
MRIKLIKAKISDRNFLLNLRNDKDSRENSGNTELIGKQDHDKWFSDQLDKNEHKIFIIKIYKKKLGYIRLQKKLKWEVSIAILKKYRNKKIGKKALLNLEKKFQKIKIFAKVNKLNTKSINFFLSCDYCIIKNLKNFYIMKKKNKNNHIKIIENISKIRSKNNSNWMQLLKIAFKYSPTEASKVMKNIYYHDKKISELVKKLK